MYKYLPYALGRQTYVLAPDAGIFMLSAQRWLFAPPFAVLFPCKVNKRKCVVPENIHTPSPPPHGGQQKIPRGGGAGGSKRRQFSWGVGLFSEVFFQGVWVRFSELLINNSFSVEQAVSYFTVTSVALIIFPLHVRSPKCFFHGERDSFL